MTAQPTFALRTDSRLPYLQLLLFLLATCLAHKLPGQERPGNSTALPWYRTKLVGMEVGPTGAQFGYSDPNDKRYCYKWNGAEIVRQAVAAKAEYLVLWLRDGDFAYYNSKMLPKAPGLGERDPLREALDEASKHQLPIISYCVVQQAGIFLEANPEWSMRGVDQKPLGRYCLNSGYLEAMKQIVAEQLEYGIAGFHIDMLDLGFGKPYGCWCDHCRQQFRDQYGHEMPQEVTWNLAWEEVLRFRYESSERFEKQLASFIKSINPQATVDFNYHGNPPFSFEVGQRPVQHAGNADFVTGETGVWGFSALGVGLNAEFYRAATPSVPYQVAMQRGVRMYHDQTTRPLNDMRWEALTLLAHGAFVTLIDKTAFDGSLDPVAYQRMRQVLDEARKKRSLFGHTPAYDVGLYFSSRTRDWIGREKPSNYFQCFQGAHQAAAMEHFQWGVILDENVTLATLQSFPIVCLPNVAILSKHELELFQEYVQQGGNLLVLGQTGLFDAFGKQQETPEVETLIGAKVKRRLDSMDNWVSIDAFKQPTDSMANLSEKLSQQLTLNWPFLVRGTAVVYEPTTALPFGSIYEPFRTTRQLEGRMGTEWPMSPERAVGPAILVHRVGQGMVITCAASLDNACASEHAIVENRTLFRNLLSAFSTPRVVAVDAPSNVQAIVTHDVQNRRLHIHLLCYNSTPRTTPAENRPYVLPGLIEDRPMYRARLRVAKEFANVSAWNESTQLIKSGKSIDLVVEDVHEVVTIAY